MKSPLSLPSRRLAAAIAAEWESQGDKIVPRTMPLMGYASTAIDRVMPRRDEVVDEIANYARTDLLCYRAEDPPELVIRQKDAWQPWLDWIAEAHGASLKVTSGVVAIAQETEAIANIRTAVAVHDAFTLTALHALTTGTGSVVLGLAVSEGYLDAATAVSAGCLDESFQAERWGEDPLAVERRERIAGELADAERFIGLLLGET